MGHISKFLIIIVSLAAIAVSGMAAPRKTKSSGKTIEQVKREQKDLKKNLSEGKRQITLNLEETQRSLNKLNTLSAEMTSLKTDINRMVGSVDSLSKSIAAKNDSVEALDSHIERLRVSYIEALRSQQRAGLRISPTMLIFSSGSIKQAYARSRYIRSFAKWRNRRSDEMSQLREQVARQRDELAASRMLLSKQVAQLQSAHAHLARQQEDTDKLVAQLKKEGAGLKKLQAERQQRAAALDRELDRLIALEQERIERERREAQARAEAEARKKKEAQTKKPEGEKQTSKAESQPKPASQPSKPAAPAPKPGGTADETRKLNGSFEANKGRLLFPVSGRYTIVRGFGRQKHPELQYVETDNAGIDIEVAQGSDARAVFNGEVSAVFKLPGYGTIVMLRHGDYISLYANLSQIYVAKGDKVETGRKLGRIFSDPDDNGRTILHFELRRERSKLNPLQWVK